MRRLWDLCLRRIGIWVIGDIPLGRGSHCKEAVVYRRWNKVDLRLIRLVTRGDASEARMPGSHGLLPHGSGAEISYATACQMGIGPATAGESEAGDGAAKYGVLVRRATCCTVPWVSPSGLYVYVQYRGKGGGPPPECRNAVDGEGVAALSDLPEPSPYPSLEWTALLPFRHSQL